MLHGVSTLPQYKGVVIKVYFVKWFEVDRQGLSGCRTAVRPRKVHTYTIDMVGMTRD